MVLIKALKKTLKLITDQILSMKFNKRIYQEFYRHMNKVYLLKDIQKKRILNRFMKIIYREEAIWTNSERDGYH